MKCPFHISLALLTMGIINMSCICKTHSCDLVPRGQVAGRKQESMTVDPHEWEAAMMKI